ncbi:MAG: hypothetical protein II674_05890 [Prevotella sp.]|nr:hypothetical protein [Prevotella sp.]
MEENNNTTTNGRQWDGNDHPTERNGHQLMDFYNPETNTLDIRSNGLYPSGREHYVIGMGKSFHVIECPLVVARGTFLASFD